MNEWYTTFLGVRQQHNYALYRFIDVVLKDTPIERFVELGTGGGALSVVLGLHAVQRGTHLLTFDNKKKKAHVKHLHKVVGSVFNALSIEYVDADYNLHHEQIEGYMVGKPTFFFCDGGNKRKDFNAFVPMLPVGSIIAAHDYGSEFQLEDLNTDGLSPLLEEYWNEDIYNLKTCFFRKEIS